PWLVMMVATEPRKLLDSHIVVNLNPKPSMADTSWIKPVREYVSIDDLTDLEAQFARLEKTGTAGVRIDLMNRTDQQTIELRSRAAKSAAAHHLMIEFENGPPPDGIERTWPNVVPHEDTAFRRLLGRL
ncbi:MAG: glycoside hydrolase family 97 catalytic domain-containing protein, partial [Terriglobales bacterium]